MKKNIFFISSLTKMPSTQMRKWSKLITTTYHQHCNSLPCFSVFAAKTACSRAPCAVKPARVQTL